MLKTFHKNRKSVGVIVLIAGIGLVMTGFGVGTGGGRQRSTYAIKIDEREIPYQVIAEQRQAEQQRMIAMLGDRYGEFAEQLLEGLNQRIVDNVIESALIEKDAHKLNLHVGANEVTRILHTKVFPKGFTKEKYRAYLRQIGVPAVAFERELSSSALRSQYVDLLRHFTTPSKLEAKAMFIEEQTSFDVSWASFSPNDFISKVEEPSAEELQQYYEAHAVNYEEDDKVRYRYIVLRPEDHEEMVEVLPEDIELYYVEHEQEFMLPETIKARHIFISAAEDEDTGSNEGEDPQALAEELHARATAGEDFSSLATQYSNDYTTQSLGGELGTLQKGEMSAEFDTAAFSMVDGGIAPLVETDKGFHIISVEEFTPAEAKDLELVRDEIIAKIKKREAPAFAAARAYELYDAWTASNLDLKEFAEQEALPVEQTKDLLFQRQDPKPFLRGLTRQVLQQADAPQQILDLGEFTLLVELLDYRERTIPELSDIQEKVLSDLKKEKAVEQARQAAEGFYEKAEASAFSTALTEEKKEAEAKTIKRNEPLSTPPLNEAATQDLIFSVQEAPALVPEVVEIENSFYVINVDKVEKPNLAEKASELAAFEAQATQMTANLLVDSRIARVKANSTIDIDQSLF